MKKGLVFASIFFFVIPSFSMKRRLTLANIDTKRKLQKTENITSDFDDVSSSSSDDYMDFELVSLESGMEEEGEEDVLEELNDAAEAAAESRASAPSSAVVDSLSAPQTKQEMARS